MKIFGKKKVELDEEQIAQLEERILSSKKIKDLAPENKRKRKEPVKPWGKKERLFILSILLLTALISAGLMIFSRGLDFPRISLNFNLGNIFEEGTIVIDKKPDLFAEKSTRILAEFDRMTDHLSGTYALYFLDLETGRSFGLNETKVMQAASLIKLPLMLYALGKVDDGLIEAMGKRSDNAVFIKLVSQFGRDEIQKYIGELGMEKTSLDQNETTPKETGDLLKKIYAGKQGVIIASLTDTIFEDWIAAGIPDQTRVAHKYGREVGVVNDAAIVFSQRPFIVVIMTQGVVEREADAIIPKLAEMIYLENE